MSQSNINDRTLTLNSSADYSSTGINTFMTLDTAADNQVVQAGTDGIVLGVLQNNPKANEAAVVAVGESVKVVAGDTITRGDRVVSDSTGRAIPIGANHNVAGRALESGVVGDLIEVVIEKYYK